MRDLKADLEILTGDWGAHESDWFRHNGTAIATHAIERAIKAEKQLEELLAWEEPKEKCYLSAMRRIAELESLVRELVAALQGVSGMLGIYTSRCRCGVCEYCNVQKRADKALAKAKEVLGDE